MRKVYGNLNLLEKCWRNYSNKKCYKNVTCWRKIQSLENKANLGETLKKKIKNL